MSCTDKELGIFLWVFVGIILISVSYIIYVEWVVFRRSKNVFTNLKKMV